MKRKLTATVLFFILAILMCAIFVSCDNATEYKFEEGMSLDEIIDAINSLDNFTWIEYFDEDDFHVNGDTSMMENYYGRTFEGRMYTNYYSLKRIYQYEFFEDNRFYMFDVVYDNEDESLGKSCWVCDYSGYDINGTFRYEQSLAYAKTSIVNSISDTENYNYVIEEGNLKFYKVGGKSTQYCIIKDCNSTDVIKMLPKEYSKYKKLDATIEPVSYSEQRDKTGNVLFYDMWFQFFHVKPQSVEVPETYNSLPIGTVYFTNSYYMPEEITLPSNVGALPELSDRYSDVSIHIIYKGTKEQWEQVPYAIEWCKNTKITVTCADGEYTVKA